MDNRMQSAGKTDELFELLSPRRLTAVVDIGANPVEGSPSYAALTAGNLCTVVGFEPQQEVLAELKRNKGPHETYLPYAVGDGQAHTLHICAASGMSGLLKPDQRMLSLFHLFPGFGELLRTEEVQTTRLDDVAEIEELDFLTIDVQGSELSVFRSGREKLKQAVAIQTEVSFVPLYENQPVFGDIDLELRSQGFIPHAFAYVKRWGLVPMLVNDNPRQGLNQLLEADVVYVRDFSRPECMSDEQLKHLALVMHHCYRSYDLALRCLLELEARQAIEGGVQGRYFELMR